MSDRPVFLYAAVYDSIDDAEADYEAVFDLHALGAIGTFDSAVIRKEEDGKVRVTKTEKPTQHGAWTGAGVGALVGLIFPPSLIGTAIVGAGAGGLIGHLRKGISRGDLKEFGDDLENGTAAVVVIGESKLEEQLREGDEARRQAHREGDRRRRRGAPARDRRCRQGGRSRGLRVVPLLLAVRGLARALAAVWRDPETRALPVVAGALVLTGTLFYWRFEDWSLHRVAVLLRRDADDGRLRRPLPDHPGTQIFTIVYILTGFGVLVALLTSVAQQYVRLKAEGGPARDRVRSRRDAR